MSGSCADWSGGAGGAGGSGGLTGPVARVGAALDEVEDLLAKGAGSGVGESGALLEWLGIMRRVEGLAVLLGSGVASGGDWAAEGFGSVRTWLLARSNAGRASVGRVVSRSSALEVCPLLVSAWLAGQVDAEHVRVVVDAHRRFPRLAAALAEAEPQIVEAACRVDPEMLGRELFGLLHRLDPEAVDDAAEARRRGEVGLHVSRVLDGYVRVDGLLPPDVGQALLSVLEAARQVTPADPSADSSASASADPTANSSADPSADPTANSSADSSASSSASSSANSSANSSASADQPPVAGRVGMRLRNVAALAHVLQVAAGVPGGLPQVAGTRPVLHVQVPLDSLLSGTLPAWVVGVSGGRVAPVSASSAQRLACDCVRRVLVVDESGMVDAVSATSRSVPSRLNMVVRVRDDGMCRFPGCEDPIREVHHAVPWSHGGVTVSSNLVGLCWHHHHLVHEGGWAVRGDANVKVTFTSAGGRSVTSPIPSRTPLLRATRRC